MKKTFMYVATVVAFFGILGTACKKSDSSSSSNSSKLVGTWTMVKTADDTNNNGTADASEWMTFATSGITGTIQINSNGTGKQTVMFGSTIVDTGSFRWSVNGDYITSVQVDSSATTSVLHIETLDDHNLTTKDTSKPVSWTVLSK